MERGWKVASEVKLKLAAKEPVPDVIADAKRLMGAYPTQPFDLCVEIVSPSDDVDKLFQKGMQYLDWGIGTVWIIDPALQSAFLMTSTTPVPVAISSTGSLTASSGESVLSLPLHELFAEVDKMTN